VLLFKNALKINLKALFAIKIEISFSKLCLVQTSWVTFSFVVKRQSTSNSGITGRKDSKLNALRADTFKVNSANKTPQV
jgi:hypothetical protein